MKKPSLWPLLLAIVMLGAALATLLWLRGKLVDGQNSVLEGTVTRFEATNVLGPPEDSSLVFEDVETLASASENDFLQSIYVTKNTFGSREVAIRPFYIDLTDPAWRDAYNWIRLPIGDAPDGWLYVSVNNTTIRAVNIVSIALAFLLIVGLGAIMIRQFGKEQELSETIGELERSKAQVIQLERLALVGQLSANIFHDIKKPVLNIKHEIADALEGSGPDSDEVYRIVYGQTELYLEMLRDLGIESFAKSGAEEKEWCDLAEAIDRSLRLVRYEQSGIEVDLQIDRNKSYLIEGWPYRFVQLFSNLILNSYQAMGEQGKLIITLEEAIGKAVITFEDSGPGVPIEKREDVFRPFVSTRTASGGSGLGLYISKQIVEGSGGSIELSESRQLGGAKFTLSFSI